VAYSGAVGRLLAGAGERLVFTMDIKVMLPREHVLLELRGDDRRSILRALSAPLVRENIVIDAEAFLDALDAREEQITTQAPGGIAFPHARSQVVRRLALTVGVATAPGLAFSAVSPERCRLFFLIAVPPAAPTVHLPLLRYLSTFVQEEKRVSRLLEAQTPAQVIRVLAALKV
jgi:fructose PTS system EIIBC or EIIC component